MTERLYAVRGAVQASANEADAHPNANIITRAVGAEANLQIDTVTGDLQPGDHFLLASDGLTRLVNDDELLEQLATNDVDKAADDLVAMALERGGNDNISLIIVGIR